MARYIRISESKIQNWIQNAVDLDNVASVVDVFILFQQQIDFILDLKWSSDEESALFLGKLLKNIEAGLEEYATIMTQSIAQDLSNLAVSKALSDSVSSRMPSPPGSPTPLKFKLKVRKEGPPVDPTEVRISSRSCVKLANMEFLLEAFDGLLENIPAQFREVLRTNNGRTVGNAPTSVAITTDPASLRPCLAGTLTVLNAVNLNTVKPYASQFTVRVLSLGNGKELGQTAPTHPGQFVSFLKDPAARIPIVVKDVDIERGLQLEVAFHIPETVGDVVNFVNPFSGNGPGITLRDGDRFVVATHFNIETHVLNALESGEEGVDFEVAVAGGFFALRLEIQPDLVSEILRNRLRYAVDQKLKDSTLSIVDKLTNDLRQRLQDASSGHKKIVIIANNISTLFASKQTIETLQSPLSSKQKPTELYVDIKLSPLLNFIDVNLGIIAETIYSPSLANRVVQGIWERFIDVAEGLIVPNLGDNNGLFDKRKAWEDSRVAFLGHTVGIVKDFLHADGRGLPSEQMEIDAWGQLELIFRFYSTSKRKLYERHQEEMKDFSGWSDAWLLKLLKMKLVFREYTVEVMRRKVLDIQQQPCPDFMSEHHPHWPLDETSDLIQTPKVTNLKRSLLPPLFDSSLPLPLPVASPFKPSPAASPLSEFPPGSPYARLPPTPESTYARMDTVQPEQQQQAQQPKSKKKIRFQMPKGFRRNEDEHVAWEVFTPLPHDQIKKGHNYIRTTKYTIVSFIPLFLYSQFRRFYNIYFLLGALSVLYGSAALSPFSQISPLATVLFFAALKDIIEDYARYRSDCEANGQIKTIVRNGVLMQIKAQDLMKGDLMKVIKNEKLSVDAIIVSCSQDDGTCFIETAELDGETNLKRRSAISALTHYAALEDVIRINLHIQCEQPNENLLSFEGRAKYTVSAGRARADRRRSFFEPEKHTEESRRAGEIVDGPGVVPLSLTHLLLRGCVLRNTDYAWASVIYTGPDTKIIMNMKKPPQKESRLMRYLNWFVMGVFVYNAILLFGSTALEFLDYKTVIGENTRWYLYGGNTDSLTINFFGALFSYFGMYTYVIPISLFIMVEMDRLMQGIFMMWDLKMASLRPPDASAPPDTPSELVHMKANNTNLNEDLATIEYVFSDKTGTLTRNEMVLAKWYLDGHIFDDMQEPGSFGEALRSTNTPAKLSRQMELFARVLVLCHGVIPSFNEISKKMVYESASPDETALIEAIARSKIFLTNRSKSTVTFTSHDVSGDPVPHVYEILHTLEFNSDRKRMSVILKDPATGKYHLYCKGADNIILERLSREPSTNSPQTIDAAIEALHNFSVTGLRTLCISYREISEDLYHMFKDAYEAAETSLVDRDLKMSAACEKVEHDLTLLGCTAIEDRLQDQVPETIAFLLKCGIKVWLLTGDKQETAINIGQSSKLIQPGMTVFKLNSKTVPECGVMLDDLKKQMDENADKEAQGFTLVVDGLSLGHVFAGNHEKKMIAVGVRCRSVICCRVTPLQKSMVVNMVKLGLNKMTLAIGDGANDVPMIMSAHVGVGIVGREGSQAVRASDFAFAEFRFLKRLLVVHGRNSYQRLSSLMLYNFYKNIAFITPQFLFGFYSVWCGQVIYEEFFMTWFNLFYSSVPPLLLGVFEIDVADDLLEKIPELYHQCREGVYWNWTLFVGVLLDSVWHSLVVFYSVYLMLGEEDVAGPGGRTIGYWMMAFIFSNVIMAVVFAKLSLVTHHWVWVSWLMIFLSVVVFVLGAIIIESISFGSVKGTYSESYSIPIFWISLPVIVAMSVIPAIAVIARRTIWPTDADIVVEQTKEADKARTGAEEAAVEMVQIEPPLLQA
ncbi:UNVERIFIED_CONTAM: hypothetical protein HDU68_007838 [Siphonaria sp. JEL0065]|nr:hypothetical protein HDU68_007838 [Siphonaria sp. JEL0065]